MKNWDSKTNFSFHNLLGEKKVCFHCTSAILVLMELMQLKFQKSQKFVYTDLFVSAIRFPLKMT